jgi:hypothetical protein
LLLPLLLLLLLWLPACLLVTVFLVWWMFPEELLRKFVTRWGMLGV